MSVKNEIRIKTKYKSIEECRDYCRDIPRKTVMATTFSRGISGEVDHDGHFELSSTQKGSAMFEFVGYIEEVDHAIYMIGEIRRKPSAMRWVYINIVLSTLIGLGLIATMNVVFIFFALLMLTIPWLNLIYSYRSNALYGEIIKKVGI